MSQNRHSTRKAVVTGGALRRGFTAIDLLVSMTVIAVLIGILVPALSTVHETARRTVCASNLRQIGFGITSFADERGGRIPGSVYKPESGTPDSAQMLRLRLGGGSRPIATWDGLGQLHNGGFLLGPKVYYCPSHHGNHSFTAYAELWGPMNQQELFGNYQYRGGGRDGVRDLFRISPARTSLVSDGMRTASDYNHVVGANVLRADLSTSWIDDRSKSGVSAMFESSADDALMSSNDVEAAWRKLDEASGVER